MDLLHFIGINSAAAEIISLQRLSAVVNQRTGQSLKVLCDFTSKVQKRFLSALDIESIKSGKFPLKTSLYGGNYEMYAKRIISIVKAFQHLNIDLVIFVEVSDENTLQNALLRKHQYIRGLQGSFHVQQICTSKEETIDFSQWQPSLLVPLQVLMTLKSLVASEKEKEKKEEREEEEAYKKEVVERETVEGEEEEEEEEEEEGEEEEEEEEEEGEKEEEEMKQQDENEDGEEVKEREEDEWSKSNDEEVEEESKRVDGEACQKQALGEVQFIYCTGDTTASMVAYAQTNHGEVGGIISGRLHLALASGCNLFYPRWFDIDNELGLQSLQINETPVDIHCVIINSRTLAGALQIEKKQLPDFGVLLGNQYTTMLNSQLPVLESLGIESQSCEAIAGWLKDKPTPLLSHCQQMADFCSSHPKYKEAVEKSYKMYDGKNSEATFTPRSPLFETLLKEAPVKNVPRSLITVARTGIFWRSSLILESLTLGFPSIYDLLLPLRKVMYLLLGLCNVTEFGRTYSKPFQHVPVTGTSENPGKSFELVESIREMDHTTRLRILFYISVNSHEVQHLSDIKKILELLNISRQQELLSEQAIFICTCLAFTGSISEMISEKEKDVLLVACLACCSSYFPYMTSASPTMRSITLSSHFMETMRHAYYIASIFDIRAPEIRSLFYPMMFVALHTSLTETTMSTELESIREAMNKTLSLKSVRSFRTEVFSKKPLDLSYLVKLFNSAVHDMKESKENLQQADFEAPKPPMEVIGGAPDEEVDDSVRDTTTHPQSKPSLLPSLQDESEEKIQETDLGVPKFPMEAICGPLEREVDDSVHEIPTSQQSKPPRLPIYKHQERILELIAGYQVVCIVGETGCGKSSQVPQFIINEAAKLYCAKPCKVLISQPNSTAAFRLAQRVEYEMKSKVGCWCDIYHGSRDTKLIYCTTELLLDALLNKKSTILEFTHIILDEIHVRSVEDDFTMFIVRMIVSQFPDKKIILMSATLQTDLFVKYYGRILGPNMIAKPYFIGTRCFNIDTYFINQLQNLLDMNLYRLKGKELYAKKEVERLLLECDTQLSNHPKITPYTKKMCTNLIISLMEPGQSVLVFFPGLSDIADYYGELTREMRRRELEHRFRIFGFHPRFIPIEEQREVFNTPPRGLIHVIIAGRAAESSITFKGLKMVINFGVRRVFEYSNIKRTNRLVMKWCSRSSCIQREGRVGRIEDGIAIHLFTKDFYDSVLPEFDSPRINTVPLSKTTLQAKVVAKKLGIKLPSQLLGSLIEPPPLLNFEASLEDLTESGALVYETQKGISEEADMTLLGRLCLSPKLDLVLGKMILMGIFFGCPLDGIVMAAALSLQQDTFTMPTIMVMKDSQKFQESLERSMNKRFHYDDGNFSNLIMMRNLFVDWLEYKHKRAYHRYHGRMKTDRDLAREFSYTSSTRADRLLVFQFQVADIASEVVKLIPRESDMYGQVESLATIIDSTKADTVFFSQNPSKLSTHGTTTPEQQKTRKNIPLNMRIKQRGAPICKLKFCRNANFLKSVITAATSNQVLCSKKCFESLDPVQQDKARRTHQAIKTLQLHPHRTVAVSVNEHNDESDDEEEPPCSAVAEDVGSNLHYRPREENTSNSSGSQSGSDDKQQNENPPISAISFVESNLKKLIKKLPPQFSYKIDSHFLMESNDVIGLVEVTPIFPSSQEKAYHGKEVMAVSSLPRAAVLLWQLGEGSRDWEVDDMPGVFFEDVFHPCEIEWQRLTSQKETVNPVKMNWRNPSSLVCDLHFSPHPHLAVASILIGSSDIFYATSLTVLPPIPKSILMVLAFQTLITKVEFLVNDCDKIQPITAVKIDSSIIKDIQLMPHHIIQINKLRAMLSNAMLLTLDAHSIPLSRSEINVLPNLLWELFEEDSCLESATDTSIHSCDPEVNSTGSEESISLWRTVSPGIEIKYTIADAMGGALFTANRCKGDIIPCYPQYEFSGIQDSDINEAPLSLDEDTYRERSGILHSEDSFPSPRASIQTSTPTVCLEHRHGDTSKENKLHQSLVSESLKSEQTACDIAHQVNRKEMPSLECKLMDKYMLVEHPPHHSRMRKASRTSHDIGKQDKVASLEVGFGGMMDRCNLKRVEYPDDLRARLDANKLSKAEPVASKRLLPSTVSDQPHESFLLLVPVPDTEHHSTFNPPSPVDCMAPSIFQEAIVDIPVKGQKTAVAQCTSLSVKESSEHTTSELRRQVMKEEDENIACLLHLDIFECNSMCSQPYTDAHVTEYFRLYLSKNGPQRVQDLQKMFQEEYLKNYLKMPTGGIGTGGIVREKFFRAECRPFKVKSGVVTLKREGQPLQDSKRHRRTRKRH